MIPLITDSFTSDFPVHFYYHYRRDQWYVFNDFQWQMLLDIFLFKACLLLLVFTAMKPTKEEWTSVKLLFGIAIIIYLTDLAYVKT